MQIWWMTFHCHLNSKKRASYSSWDPIKQILFAFLDIQMSQNHLCLMANQFKLTKHVYLVCISHAHPPSPYKVLVMQTLCSRQKTHLRMYVATSEVTGTDPIPFGISPPAVPGVWLLYIGQTDREQIHRINNNWCTTFRPRRPLSTAYKSFEFWVYEFCMQLTKAYVAKTSCISCHWFCYVSAHNQFAQYQQCSNDPLRHHL